MKRISANVSSAFVAMWCALVAAVLAGFWFTGVAQEVLVLFAGTAVLGGLGLAATRRAPGLAGEVYDCGDSLLVRSGTEEERIPILEITRVHPALQMGPPRVTLHLAAEGKFGNEVAFSPVRRFTLNPFGLNEVAEDLSRRVRRAGSGRAPSSS